MGQAFSTTVDVTLFADIHVAVDGEEVDLIELLLDKGSRLKRKGVTGVLLTADEAESLIVALHAAVETARQNDLAAVTV